MNELRPRKTILLLIWCLSVLGCAALSASSEPISFRGGYTRAIMREGRETIVLSQGAVVQAGSIQFEAQSIELIGPQARYITAQGGVRITDGEQGLVITSTSLSYDRVTQQLLVDGWVEVQDLQHEVIASGAYLSFSRIDGTMRLQIAAKLLSHTESGPMICRADSIEYDREKQMLILVGNAQISWKGDVYQSSITTVNLLTDEIVMEGTIRGTVNG